MPLLNLDQGTISYRDTGGAGAPIVFLHGLFVDGRLWDAVLPRLGARRLIVPDWPLGAHRAAMRPDADLRPPGLARLVAGALQALDLDDVTLVANDTGGAIAQLVVTRHPERIARLVLTNCDAYENFLPPLFRPLRATALVPGLAALVAQGMRFERVRNMPFAFGRLTSAPMDGRLTADWAEPVRLNRDIRHDAVKVLRGISKRYTLDAAAALHTFTGRTLIAWGRNDTVFRPAFAERLAADSADARLEWIEGSRAFVPVDQPARLAELISDFAGQ